MKNRSIFITIFLLRTALDGEMVEEPLDSWNGNVQIKAISTVPERHTIHSYYLTNPESPDGKKLLYFTSVDPGSRIGEVRVMDLQSGREIILASNVATEDAHRVACQQWLSGGKRVAFHEVVDKKWRVVVVDVDTLEKTIIAEDRQLGYGQPESDILLLYGCHWNPGSYRDLYLWNANTKKITTAVSVHDVESKHEDWLKNTFGEKKISIFFPVLSPDTKRVFFKIAAGNGGDDYMSRFASHRQGTVCAEVSSGKLLWFHPEWGHPGWMNDSRHILNVHGTLYDTDGGPTKIIPKWPRLPGTHPAASPDGSLLVSDGRIENLGGATGEWGIVVGDVKIGNSVLLKILSENGGADSWRRNHPHPVFSADGNRIYFNVNDGKYTRLFVAHRDQSKGRK